MAHPYQSARLEVLVSTTAIAARAYSASEAREMVENLSEQGLLVVGIRDRHTGKIEPVTREVPDEPLIPIAGSISWPPARVSVAS